MDPIQFVRLAEWLLAEQRHAAGFRSAISLAYYGAHHYLRQFVESAGIRVVGSAGAHSDVWNHLIDVGDTEIEKVASDLADLHSARVDADYRLSIRQPENQGNVRAAIATAKDLINLARACRDDATRWNGVADGIRKRHALLRNGKPDN